MRSDFIPTYVIHSVLKDKKGERGLGPFDLLYYAERRDIHLFAIGTLAGILIGGINVSPFFSDLTIKGANDWLGAMDVKTTA